MTPADPKALAVARKASGRLERRYARRVEPGELLSPAYLAVMAGRPAAGGCFDYLRGRDGRPGSTRSMACRMAVPLASDPPHRASRQPILAVWCESRPQRYGMDWRERVMLYLHLVEGQKLEEIGRAFGVSKAMAAMVVAAAVEHLTGRRLADIRREVYAPGAGQ